MKKILSLTLSSLVILSMITRGQNVPASVADRFKKMEADNLSKPYEGIKTSKGFETGLFPIKSTGVTTKPIKDAGESFLRSLTKEQLAKTQYDIQNIEWQKWSNVDHGLYTRQGISIK